MCLILPGLLLIQEPSLFGAAKGRVNSYAALLLKTFSTFAC